MSRSMVSVGLSFLCAPLLGCNFLAPVACTQAGCASGIRVVLEGTPTAPFTVSATAGATTQSVSCELATECNLFFEELTPSQVTISYESGGQVVEDTFTPSYTRSRPNGDDCPPVCLNGTVVLDLQ